MISIIQWKLEKKNDEFFVCVCSKNRNNSEL